MKSNASFPVLLLLCCLFFACKKTPKQTTVAPTENTSAAKFIKEKISPTASEIGNRTAKEMVAAGFKRYGIEKGYLIFRLDGAVKGSEFVYFDHWGWREGKHVNTEAHVGAYRKATKMVQYLDGERRYEYDIATNTATFFESKQVQTSADFYKTRDMVVIGDEMIKKMGGEKAGKGDVQGAECDIWEIPRYQTTLHMWNGLTMKERSTIEDMPVARTCMLLDTESEVPVEKMVLPEGVKEVKLGD